MRSLTVFCVLVSFVALSAASGCSSRSDEETVATGEVGSLVETDVLLATGSSCHGTDASEAAIRDLESWLAWWREAACGSTEPPEVGFASSMVLAVQDREGPTGCYRVRIAEVRTGVGGGYHVVVNRHVPTRATPCPMVVVHPAAAVRVPAVRGPVVFEWRTLEGPPPVLAR